MRPPIAIGWRGWRSAEDPVMLAKLNLQFNGKAIRIGCAGQSVSGISALRLAG